MREIDKSGFIRRLHGLQEQLVALFLSLGQSLRQLNTSSHYLIDSFSMAVCNNIRIARCRLIRGEGFRGRCVSKLRYFYGFRLQLIAKRGCWWPSTSTLAPLTM